MRGLLAKLIDGEISRRNFTSRMLGMGFGMMTVESILDTVAIAHDKKRAGGKKSETFRADRFRLSRRTHEVFLVGNVRMSIDMRGKLHR